MILVIISKVMLLMLCNYYLLPITVFFTIIVIGSISTHSLCSMVGILNITYPGLTAWGYVIIQVLLITYYHLLYDISDYKYS